MLALDIDSIEKGSLVKARRGRRAVVFVVPLLIALVSTFRIAEDVRAVDFLQILACGAIIGVSLAGLIDILRGRRESNS